MGFKPAFFNGICSAELAINLHLCLSCVSTRCSVEREGDTYSKRLAYHDPYRKFTRVASAFALMGLLGASASATELKPGTANAFDRYIQVTEAQMARDVHNGIFLRIDALPEAQRKDACERLRRGEVPWNVSTRPRMAVRSTHPMA